MTASWVDSQGLDAETLLELSVNLTARGFWQHFRGEDDSTSHTEGVQIIMDEVREFQSHHANTDWTGADFWMETESWADQIMVRLRGDIFVDSDNDVHRIVSVLRKKFDCVDVYRYNFGSIHVRVVSSSFAGCDAHTREDMVNPLIETLPPDVSEQITQLVLITPTAQERMEAPNYLFERGIQDRVV